MDTRTTIKVHHFQITTSKLAMMTPPLYLSEPTGNFQTSMEPQPFVMNMKVFNDYPSYLNLNSADPMDVTNSVQNGIQFHPARWSQCILVGALGVAVVG